MKKRLFSLLYDFGLVRLLRSAKKNYLTVLSLHRISNERDFFFDPIPPELFEELIKYLVRHYHVISFADLKVEKSFSKPPVILSFDDGYYDFYEHALPILTRYKIPSNHNIVNKCADSNCIIWTQRLNYIFNYCREKNIWSELKIDNNSYSLKDFGEDWFKFYISVFHSCLKMNMEDRINFLSEKESMFGIKPNYRMMNWSEISECLKNGVEIGCHTYSHDVLSTISSSQDLIREISLSKTEMEAKIGAPVDIIALPNGQGNEKVNDFVKSGGFNYLLYVDNKPNRLKDIGRDSNLKILKRVGLINESYKEMILRTELFHSKIKSYV